MTPSLLILWDLPLSSGQSFAHVPVPHVLVQYWLKLVKGAKIVTRSVL